MKNRLYLYGLVNTALGGNCVSRFCSPRVSLSLMDVCHGLELQSVTALLDKLYMTAREMGLGTSLGRGLTHNQP